MSMDTSEKRFERDIEHYFITHGYRQFSRQNEEGKWIRFANYDINKAIYLDVLVEFVSKSQPKEWARYLKYYGNEAPQKLYRRFENEVVEHGLIYVLKHGITDLGIKLKLCFFKPESELNDKSIELYNQNILGVERQFGYSSENNNTIDMVLSLNGIPLFAFELKNQFKGQDYNNAIVQYKTDRNPKEFCFKLNHRFLAYFACDLYEVWMTTQLKGQDTYFLPFNQGSNGAGKTGGKGNPANENGYPTSYLWEDVFSKDNFIDLIHRFISFIVEKEEVIVKGETKEKKTEKLIFPRYHQYDVVRKVIADVKANGTGHDYLIQHSAGSGKSNSIAWIAYRLASLHDEENNPIFNSVIVVTNRVVLDSQLQDTINSFDHITGLVEAITKEKHSRGLTDAINDKKRIIICTVQKFLYAYKDFDDLDGRKFAIIIDEAHQGQSGESAKTLKRSLIDKKQAIKEYALEEDVEQDEIEVDEILEHLMAQGKHKNQSFFAFTATPKNKTIELFGVNNLETGKKEAFHTYSMRQAIEESFILDVLQNYTTIKEAFKLIKVSADNPELIEGPASKALFKYYKEHGYTIAQKTEMLMTNFLQNGRFKINGKGKAMIIADSRANAVRYYFAIKEFMKNNPELSQGSNVLVAFSGTVKLDGVEYTEAGMNIGVDGKPINSDKKFRKAFRSDHFNIMVVANKYQTGFDEPLLHSMYVDKKLKGVNAVQTLSRLNRTCRGKNDTFVLDFENTDAEIKDSFQPFYEGTNLDGVTDYNKVYDLRTKIRGFMLFSDDDIIAFNKVMSSQGGKKQDDTAQGKLASILKPIIDRYNELDEKERYVVRDTIRKFNKNYSYITQLIRLHDEELFKEFLFTSHLISLLPKEKREYIDIEDKIKLEYASLKETFKGAITLDKKSVDLKPSGSTQAKPTKKKDTLQSIIDKVNERFDGKFTDSDRVIIEGIYQMFMKDDDVKKFRKYAKANNTEMFVNSLFPEKFKDIVTKCFLENNDSFEKLFNDPDFYQKVMEAMAKELYKTLRKSED